MNADDPRHGSPAGAAAHRKANQALCDPCKRAAYIKRKATGVRLLSGVRHRIPLGERAWRIVNAAGPTAVQQATGINRNMLCRLNTGGPETPVLLRTQQRILAVDDLATPIGIVRRLQALSAIGHSMLILSEATGVDVDTLKRLRRRANPQFVCSEVRVAVLSYYDAHYMNPLSGDRSSDRTRALSAGRGWAPPMAWDDIDDSAAKPQGVIGWNNFRDPNSVDPMVVERILGGDWRLSCTRAEKEAVCARFMRNGGSSKTLGELTGWRIERYWHRSDAA